MVKVNLEKTSNGVLESLDGYKNKVTEIDKTIVEKTGKGNDFLGWVDYPNTLDNTELDRIEAAAKRLKDNCDVVLVIGIGGSFLGAKACIDAIHGVVTKTKPEIIYCGNTVSPTYTKQVIDYIKGKKIGINIISKSGTTTEPSIAFRLALTEAKKVWGKDYYKYVLSTTDKARGVLHDFSIEEKFEMFVIPDDVGGRYSVFTPVGLIPMAIAGLNIKEFINGARQGVNDYDANDLTNQAYVYACVRNYLHTVKGNAVEFLISYEPQFVSLAEWWKQLYGESEGKEGKALLPGSLCFSTDLHSMGQYCQEGTSCFFETTLRFKDYQDDIKITSLEGNKDKLDYLTDVSLSTVENIVIDSTLEAHFIEGHRDNVVLEIEKMNEFNLGNLMYFFCKACAMSAYLLDVNPFNQPGVEVYKARMKEKLHNL